MNDSIICSFVFVVLNSFDDVPSFFLTPSIRKPNVAVDDIVSRQTMYLELINYKTDLGHFKGMKICFITNNKEWVQLKNVDLGILSTSVYLIYVMGPLACLSLFPAWFWIRSDLCSDLRFLSPASMSRIYWGLRQTLC